jgi:peptide/nickel transport system substrate-binding protein
MIKKRRLPLFVTLVILASVVLAACQPSGAVQTVVVTEIVEGEVVERVVTATPVPEEAPPPATYSGEFKNPDNFVAAVYGEPETFDPAWTYESAGAAVQQNIYEGMVDFNKSKAEEFVPALAESWEVSEDGLTYTFHIREGVTFHEGGTLEPHDIAYAIQRGMFQDRTDGPQWLLLEPFFGVSTMEDLVTEAGSDDAACEQVKAAVAADDEAGTVTLTLAAPFPPILQVLAQQWGAALDMEWMVDNGDWDGECATWRNFHDPEASETILFDAANGTGPYKLERWVPGEEIVLIRNDNYWRTEPMWEGGPSGPASIERVTIKLVEEWSTRLAMMEAGDADYIESVTAYISQIDPLVKYEYDFAGTDNPPAEPTMLNEEGGLTLYRGFPRVAMTPAMFIQQINVEGGNPFIGTGALDGSGIPPDFFSDIHARKAFNYCFDFDTYIQDAWQGEAIQPKGPIIAGMLGWREDQPTYSYDPDKCVEEFQAAWGGQVWENGFYMQVTYNTGNEARRIAAEVIEKGVESVNDKFDIAVVNLPWPTYLEARRGGKLPIAISGWIEDYHDPANWVHPFMHPTAGAYARVQAFPEDFATQVETLIDKAAVMLDPEARRPIYEELQQMAYDEAIDIFIYQETGREYFQNWVEGWYYNPIHPEAYAWIYALSKTPPAE